MWMDIKKYKDYEKLNECQSLIIEDLKNWLSTHKIEEHAKLVYNKPKDEVKIDYNKSQAWLTPTGITFIDPEETVDETEDAPNPSFNPENYKHTDNWRFIPGYVEGKWNTDFLVKSIKNLKELQGLLQCNINFLTPFGKITPHLDVGSWNKMATYYNKPDLDGYLIVSTIHSGMTDPKTKTVGMRVGIGNSYTNWQPDDYVERRYPLVGELVCFDGRRGVHDMWNNTPEWRITAVFDIDINSFNK
jgi:hypothetical protein